MISLGLKRALVESRKGSGKKWEEWVSELQEDVFARLRKLGVKFTNSALYGREDYAIF